MTQPDRNQELPNPSLWRHAPRCTYERGQGECSCGLTRYRAAWAGEPARRATDLASERGRLLAERDRLIAAGVDPADLELLDPMPPARRAEP